MNQPAVKFEDHVGLIHQQAKNGLRWATGAGAGLDYDDMFQIASVAFLQAAEKYDPTTGFKFSAYYTQAAFSEFRREIGIMTGVKNLNAGQRAEIQERREENAQRRAAGKPELPEMNYGLRAVAFGDLPRLDDESHSSYEDNLPCDGMTPEEKVEFAQVWAEVTADLSPMAALMVEWLRDPPEQLLAEIAAQGAHSELAEAAGVRVTGLHDGVSIAAIVDFLRMVSDVKEGELTRAKSELRKVVTRIEEIYRS
jgi:hypothetical protein